jgi:membrane protein implicated in regulation of membrane protease activity
MCHLVLLLPVLALPLFWLAPLSIAVPAYALVVVLSGAVYWLVVSAMRRPVQIGAEALAHNTGEVIATDDGVLRVRIHNEIWNARSADDLEPGDRIEVIAVEAMRLKVRRIGDESPLGLVR